MMKTKYMAQTTRSNPGKGDYEWTYAYINKQPVLYDTEAEALAKAQSACADESLSMYNPRAVAVEIK